MPQHNVKLIINPHADFGRAWHIASDLRPIIDEFGGADWAGTVYPTHAAELAQQAAEDGYELVIAAGGDGTIHEVINGLMQVPIERRPQLGVVPMGSGNDFAHAVGMEIRPEYALRQIFSGEPKWIDVGVWEDDHGRREYYSNVLGIGFDAKALIRTHKITYLHGKMMYTMAALQTILMDHEAPNMRITTDQEDWEQNMLMLVVSNGEREGGSYRVTPEARLDDGYLDYAGIGPVSRFMLLRLLPEVMKGTHGRFSEVRTGKLQRMEIISDRPLMIHNDGETVAGYGMNVRQLTIEVVPGAIQMMV
jgi:YegS/Rv2252/BmrU family lipid kinase